jgi:DNA-binding Lrp family transcriptional regulator
MSAGTEGIRNGELQPAGVTMTLRTRTPVCGSRTTVIDRLGRLRATGAIEGFEVRTWPDEVVLSDGTEPDPAVATFERLEAWATDRGLSLRPPFDVRTVSSLLGRERELLTLPMMCLSVAVDDALVGVYPCDDGERTWTIADCLDAYETADDPLAAVERTGVR